MIPPRWFLRSGWALHRAVTALTRGRLGLSSPTERRLGTLFLTTRGRTTGAPRRVGLFYLDAPPDRIVVASNAGADPEPAWWRNLQATPEASIELPGPHGPVVRAVRARRATPAERDAWYPRFVERLGAYAEYARATDRVIDVVVLEPREEAATIGG